MTLDYFQRCDQLISSVNKFLLSHLFSWQHWFDLSKCVLKDGKPPPPLLSFHMSKQKSIEYAKRIVCLTNSEWQAEQVNGQWKLLATTITESPRKISMSPKNCAKKETVTNRWVSTLWEVQVHPSPLFSIVDDHPPLRRCRRHRRRKWHSTAITIIGWKSIKHHTHTDN